MGEVFGQDTFEFKSRGFLGVCKAGEDANVMRHGWYAGSKYIMAVVKDLEAYAWNVQGLLGVDEIHGGH